MPHNRFFSDAPFESQPEILLEETEWHHLAHVFRTKEGEHVELVNGRGQLAQATVLELRKKSALLKIDTFETKPLPSPLILALAMPRKNHLEWIIEKGTELGATAFWLFPGMWSEKEGLSPSQEQRLHSLCIAAMKQCGRLDLPKIEKHPPLLDWKKGTGTLLFGDTEPSAPYLWTLPPLSLPITLLIGPERGLSPQEVEHLKTVLKAQGTRLHPHILRAETAPLVALSLIQTKIINN